tara:strand:+ start:1558 stop:1959 length:402 start_codon:yes stop_codon:yes gene_type:complete
MKINNSNFFNLNESLIIGLKKEIEDNPLLLPFFTSNAASKLLKSIIHESADLIAAYVACDSSLLNEINSLLTFVDQNSNKDEFYTRHLGESKNEFYSRTNIKSYKMYSEIFRIKKISDKAIQLIKTVNQLSHL